MGKRVAVHMKHSRYAGRSTKAVRVHTQCNIYVPTSRITEDASLVTCKSCQKRLKG